MWLILHLFYGCKLWYKNIDMKVLNVKSAAGRKDLYAYFCWFMGITLRIYGQKGVSFRGRFLSRHFLRLLFYFLRWLFVFLFLRLEKSAAEGAELKKGVFGG